MKKMIILSLSLLSSINIYSGFFAQEIEIQCTDGFCDDSGVYNIENMTINNNAKCNKSIFFGNVNFCNGDLIATTVNFKKNVNIDLSAGKKYELINTSIEGSINVKNNTKHKAIIILKGKTQLLGDVKFENGTGEVHLFKDSKIKGKVINGIIKRIN